MKPKIYLTILKFGLLAAPFTFLLVFPSLLFPYITSKQLTFNILMEILAAIWIVFIIKYPEYRLKKNWLTWGIVAYFVAIGLSCLVGVDFNLSFWGNAERMLGLFHLTHFLLFYLILITVMRTPRDWNHFFDVSIVVSVLIVLHGLANNYPAATIGNAAYVAGLMIFNIAFAVWRLISCKEWYGKVLFSLALVLLLIGFIRADISGAYAGLVIGAISAGVIYFLVQNKKKGKIVGLSVVGSLVLLLVLLFAFKSSPVFDNSFLGKALRDFSANNPTLNTRLLSWKAAYQDFSHHPILGTGHGNYAVTFDKYLTTEFFRFSPNETYFDRAHNNLIDIVSTTGIIGLLTYLAIFAAVVYYLRRAFKEKKVNPWQLAVLGGLFIAYFVQNLAVFDSLVTYVSLFALLAFVYYLSQSQPEVKNETSLAKSKEVLLLIGLLLLALIFTARFNLRGFQMLSGAIKGYSYVASGYITDGVNYYKTVFASEVGYNRDSRSSLVNLLISNPQALMSLPPTEARANLAYAVELAQKNIAYNPNDSMLEAQLAKIADVAARFNYQDMEKFNYYSAEAVTSIDYSIAASPGRYPLYFTKADIHMTRGELSESIAAIKKALELRSDFAPGYCQLAKVYYFFEDYDNAYLAAGECAQRGQVGLLTPRELVTKSAKYYLDKGDEVTLKILQDYLAASEPQVE